VNKESIGEGANDLRNHYSDFHKDVHGSRPQHSDAEWSDDKFVQSRIDQLHKTLNHPDNREHFKGQGWSFKDEPTDEARGLAPVNAYVELMQAVGYFISLHTMQLMQLHNKN
jgi:hypothetical protein